MGIRATGSRLALCIGLVMAAVAAVAVTAASAARPASAAKVSKAHGLALAEANVHNWYSGAYFRSPPTTGPKPARGKNIWFITVSQSTPATWVRGAETAAKAIGWHLHVWDGKYSPAVQLQGVQSAIAAHANGIMLDAIDCAPLKAALQQAHAAGIKIVDSQGVDCNQGQPGAPKLFDGTVRYENGDTLAGFDRSFGKAKADWVAVKTKGEGRIINIVYDDSFKKHWEQPAIANELKRVCPGCKVVDTLHFTGADLIGPAIRQDIEQALLKYPNANAVIAPFDDFIIAAGGDAAVRNSGRSNKIWVIGESGYVPSIKEIHSNGGLDATLAFSFDWDSWAMIDDLNRLFHGQKPVMSGSAGQLVDRTHNSASGAWTPPVNFKKAYLKAWGKK